MRFVLLVSIALIVAACLPRRVNAPWPPDVHHHVVPVHQRPWTTELAPDAQLVTLEGVVAGADSAISPDGRWRTFVYMSPDEPGGRVCIETVAGAQREELRGLPLPHRPLTALVWLNDRLLAFDRWSQPHHGIHYVLDVVQRKLVLAAPFPDTVSAVENGDDEPSPQQRIY